MFMPNGKDCETGMSGHESRDNKSREIWKTRLTWLTYIRNTEDSLTKIIPISRSIWRRERGYPMLPLVWVIVEAGVTFPEEDFSARKTLKALRIFIRNPLINTRNGCVFVMSDFLRLSLIVSWRGPVGDSGEQNAWFAFTVQITWTKQPWRRKQLVDSFLPISSKDWTIL